MDAIHVTNSRSSSFSSPPPPPPQVYESLISRSEAAFPYSSHQEIENHFGTSRGGRGMNSLNLQGISWNFFARDRCVSVSITQSRLIARGHHQLRLILFRVGSIPRPRITFFFFFFFFTPWNERASSHRYSFSLSSAGSIRTPASSSVKDWRSIIDP